MKILLTGASGLLGSYLLRTAPKEHEIHSERFDILEQVSVHAAVDGFRPEVIIHCAAEGRVDYAEAEPAAARLVNVTGTHNLLVAAERHKAHFVLLSTNAVFDGRKPPYAEKSPQRPINKYGQTKQQAEDLLGFYPHRSTVIRPILLYGWPMPGRRDNFATRVLSELREGREVRVAQDIITQPTYAKDCAQAIWMILQKQSIPEFTINVAPREAMSLYRFACDIALAFELDPKLVIPVPSSEIRTLAPRPMDTTYDVTKLDRMGIVLSPPEFGLARMRKEIR